MSDAEYNLSFTSDGISGWGELRGQTRTRWLVSLDFRYIGSVEGCLDSWRNEADLFGIPAEERAKAPFYKTRKEAAEAIVASLRK